MGYVTIFATPKAGKKTSKAGKIFSENTLISALNGMISVMGVQPLNIVSRPKAKILSGWADTEPHCKIAPYWLSMTSWTKALP